MVSVYESDIVVVGSGIAGLCFALEVAEKGTVTILTKKEDFESSTNYAQGGIACVSTAEDSFEEHIRDTLVAGAGLCHEEAVRDLVKEGPSLVHQLIDWGVRFTQKEKEGAGPGKSPHDLSLYDLGREGGHSHRRILHSKDLTGREVERALLDCLRGHHNVNFLEHHTAVDLLTETDAEGETCCTGVLGMDSGGSELKLFRSRVTLLATGGLGRIYQHTTNPSIATGDGVAMAWRKGIPVANLEFVQFHPTSFYSPSGKTFLISEAVRGEGAQLRRIDGNRFMADYDEREDLAPRDIVARAIDTEMKNHGDPYVVLDCSMMEKDFFSERFPAILELCKQYDVHPPKDPIPVVPAAHYSCGGVVTDRQGRTSLPGLLVSGETAFTGIHGANRLASNSLLEALVYSHRAAEYVLGEIDDRPLILSEGPDWCERWKSGADFEVVRIEHCKGELQRLMWDYVGIVRRTNRLELPAERISLLKREVEGYFNEGFGTPAIIELRNMVQTAELVVECALRRQESRGLHYSQDYPDPPKKIATDTILVPAMAGFSVKESGTAMGKGGAGNRGKMGVGKRA